MKISFIIPRTGQKVKRFFNVDPKKTLDNLVNRNYKKYLQFAKNMANGKDDPRDVLQECLTEIYEMKIEKQSEILPYFEYYLIRMLKFSFRSDTSRYQQKYNKLKIDANVCVESLLEDIIETETESPSISEIENVLNENCSWYEREVFLRYVNGNKSFKTFEKETGIPASSLYNTYNKVKKILQEKLYLIKK